ncbi:MAG: F0F1 ATP synthase subunit A [Candidatus Omnitrophica bacterium]|nr:F0F1 ATP synthase subunit A [Candidatus Omnitrophota bacterium]
MSQPAGEQFALDDYIMHHVANGQEWALPFLPTIQLAKPLSLHLLMFFIASVFLFILLVLLYREKGHQPKGRVTNAIEAFVLFIRNEISIQCLGEEDGRRMTPLFCTFFFLILTLNLMGLIPIFSTATANFNITGALALVTFGYMTFGAIRKNGIGGFIHAFVPSGVPVVILFILIPIEILGFMIRPFVLMVRLFANLLGGHIVLLSLTGMTALIGMFTLPIVIPVVLFIYLLEIFVAFLQAYIFTFLSAMFISLFYHPEH